jgi:hypothetical protein
MLVVSNARMQVAVLVSVAAAVKELNTMLEKDGFSGNNGIV